MTPLQKLDPNAAGVWAKQIDGNPALRANVMATLSSHQVLQQFLQDRIPELEHTLHLARENADVVQANIQMLVTVLGGEGGSQ